ncbi:phosphatase domain-containing protein [Verrucomicrobiaceae bacterium 227]
MRRFLHRLALKLEKIWDRWFPPSLDDGRKAMIENYDGFANDSRVVLRGRVLKCSKEWEFTESDSAWKNFRGITRYWLTREVQNAPIFGEIIGQKFETISDEEGYFSIEIPRPPSLNGNDRWVTMETWLKPGGERFQGRVQVAGPDAQRLIISDIDDTVMETGAQKLWQMLKTTLLKNIHTRSVFPGVSQLYSDLTAGGKNPLYYVTSSPWNLRAFLQKIFELRGIPRGPAFMTDWGLDENKFFKDGHGHHKLRAIENILTFHPTLPCILIGDSGEKDPEIYSEIVKDFPERVEVIYIRDVSNKVRDEKIRELARSCALAGVPLLLVESTLEAAKDALKRKFINPLEKSPKSNPRQLTPA